MERGGSVNKEQNPAFIYVPVLELMLLPGYCRLQSVPAIRVLKVPDPLKKKFYQNHPQRKINLIQNEHFSRRYLLPSKIIVSVGKQLLKHGVKSSGFQFGVSHSPAEYCVVLVMCVIFATLSPGKCISSSGW